MFFESNTVQRNSYNDIYPDTNTDTIQSQQNQMTSINTNKNENLENNTVSTYEMYLPSVFCGIFPPN